MMIVPQHHHQTRARASAAAGGSSSRPAAAAAAAPLSLSHGVGRSRLGPILRPSGPNSSNNESTPAPSLASRAAALAAAALVSATSFFPPPPAAIAATTAPSAPAVAVAIAAAAAVDAAAPAPAAAAEQEAPQAPPPPQEFVRLPASPDPAIFEAQKSLAEAWQIVGETFFDGRFNGHGDWPQELREHMLAAFSAPDPEKAYERGVDALLAELGDPYTRRVPADEYDSFRVSSEGALQGVGLLLAVGTGNSGAPPPPPLALSSFPSPSPSPSGVGGGSSGGGDSAGLPRLTVLAPVRGGPAERAGVLPGDEVVAIEGQPTDGWTGEQAARVLRGAGGTEVRVRFARAYDAGGDDGDGSGGGGGGGGAIPGVRARSPAPVAGGSGGGGGSSRALMAPFAASSPGGLDTADASPLSSPPQSPSPQSSPYRTFDVRLVRERVELSPVVSALLRSPAGRLPIGYLRLTSFSQNAAAELRKAMAELDARALGANALPLAGGGGGGGGGGASSSSSSSSSSAAAAFADGGSAAQTTTASSSSSSSLPISAAGSGGALAGYVLDLRGNGGGLVRAGIEVAAAFLPGAPTVFQVTGRDGEPASRVVLPPPETDAEAQPSAEAAALWWSRLRGEGGGDASASLSPAALRAERQAAVAWRETPVASLPADDDGSVVGGGADASGGGGDGAGGGDNLAPSPSSSSSSSSAAYSSADAAAAAASRRPPPADATTPLVVLVDAGTASASEIVTGALRDNRRLAAVVGADPKTYGKGRIQSVFELRDGSALFVTVARYRTPRGGEIDQVGIAPDRRCARPGAGGGALGGAGGGGGGGGARGRGGPLRVRAGGAVVELGEAAAAADGEAGEGASSSSSFGRRAVNPLAVMAGGGAVSRRDELMAARQIERDGCVLAATRLLERGARPGGGGGGGGGGGAGSGGAGSGAVSAGEAARLAAARLAAARLPPIGVLGAALHAEAPPLR